MAGPKGLANMTDRPIDVKVIAAREKGNDRSSEKAMTVCLFMCRKNRCSHLSSFFLYLKDDLLQLEPCPDM